ncbi:hypothetical protein WJX72_003110 [[Myrmecia] bisecta]|uniref:Germin-like protein n=1 Tax=[Myrmecia] bisecta TaxID=41462 RepID=A0AAW1Q6U6_9CHLO
MWAGTLVCVVVAALLTPAQGRQSASDLAVTEATLRREVDFEGMLFNFNDHDQITSPNGGIQRNLPFNNAFLSTTMEDAGTSQILVTLGACAGNTPHSHPRASENAFLLYGTINFGIVEENENGARLVVRNMTQNTTFHVPRGLLHYSHNLDCKPAAFIANFNNKDPGTQDGMAPGPSMQDGVAMHDGVAVQSASAQAAAPSPAPTNESPPPDEASAAITGPVGPGWRRH